MSIIRTLAAVAIASVIATASISAQGNSASAPGKNKDKSSQGGNAATNATSSPATSVSPTSAPSSSATRSVYFGSWLDDASVMEPGSVWVGLSSAYWRANASQQVDAPVMLAAAGISPRVQIGGSVPFYHFRDPDGLTASGVGTLSLYGKLVAIEPSAQHRVGLAFAPLIEVVPGADRRVGWAFPVNVETRVHRMRLYGSTGFFSRGSAFGTAAIEAPVGSHAAVTANFGEAFGGDGQRQTDVGAGIAYFATRTSGVFATVGRTFASNTLSPGGLSFGGGVSFLLPSTTP